ncbi:hypothetical protein LR48_Vigan09g223000 [Vigna angularis]|uniref:Uncharacterized protein n=1 Tax=Phaseolus angularis TaxID=3914 RepID=A0A0L9VEU2_PHAAN|nr:hypothetical protein LR48_Vigan09g223000 [Vigna angularis]
MDSWVLALNFGKSRILAAISLRGVFGAASGRAKGLLQIWERRSGKLLELEGDQEHCISRIQDSLKKSSRVNFVFWSVYPYTQSIVDTQVEENNVSGESRGRSSSIVFEFRHRQIGGFTLLVLEKDQLNYASAKTTDSSTVIQIRMSHVCGFTLHSVGECQLNYASVK